MAIGKETRFYNPETGEIFRSKRQVFSEWDEEKGYMYRYREVAIRSFAGERFPEGLSVTDIGRLCILSKHTSVTMNILAKKTRAGYRPMTATEIGEVIGLGERQSYAFLKNMIQLGMIAKVKVEMEGNIHTKYYLNPVYFIRGKYIDTALYFLFQESLDKHLPDAVRRRFMESLAEKDK